MNLPFSFADKILMTPGPVPLPAYVKQVFSDCDVHHRGGDFSQVLERCFSQLKKIFQTQEHCYILPATGTGAMEATLVNIARPGAKVLVIKAGKFGERWQKLAKAFELDVDVFLVEWGRDLDLGELEKKLSGDNYDILFTQACETSTGAMLPVEDIGKICQKLSTLLVVDGITALAAYSVPMDSWSIDALIGGSQKGFMLPTGVSFLSLSKKAQAAMTEKGFAKYYWDLAAEKVANQKGITRYSTPAHFVLALDLVLDEILEQRGLQNYFDLINRRAELFRSKVNLQLFPTTPSPSLSCL